MKFISIIGTMISIFLGIYFTLENANYVDENNLIGDLTKNITGNTFFIIALLLFSIFCYLIYNEKKK
jgi:amino acid permease